MKGSGTAYLDRHGGIRNPWNIAKAIAMGADGVVVGTAEIVATGCIRCGRCESGRGCARGICMV